MDDVLADFSIAVLNRIQIDYPYYYNGIWIERISILRSDYDKEHRATITAISEEPGFFASVPLIDNALTGWQRIVDLGDSPQICS